MTTFPIGPWSDTTVDPFTGEEVTQTITHLTILPNDC